MLENFIYAKQKSLFEEALNNGEVLDEAIVFIEDTKEIWNHGTYFDGKSVDLSNIESSIQDIINKANNLKELLYNITELTYSELKALVDNSELIPGHNYAITDYTCIYRLPTSKAEMEIPCPDVKYIICTANTTNTLLEDVLYVRNDGYLKIRECKYTIDPENITWTSGLTTLQPKGAVYYMKDAKGNACNYDFKHVKFRRWAVTDITPNTTPDNGATYPCSPYSVYTTTSAKPWDDGRFRIGSGQAKDADLINGIFSGKWANATEECKKFFGSTDDNPVEFSDQYVLESVKPYLDTNHPRNKYLAWCPNMNSSSGFAPTSRGTGITSGHQAVVTTDPNDYIDLYTFDCNGEDASEMGPTTGRSTGRIHSVEITRWGMLLAGLPDTVFIITTSLTDVVSSSALFLQNVKIEDAFNNTILLLPTTGYNFAQWIDVEIKDMQKNLLITQQVIRCRWYSLFKSNLLVGGFLNFNTLYNFLNSVLFGLYKTVELGGYVNDLLWYGVNLNYRTTTSGDSYISNNDGTYTYEVETEGNFYSNILAPMLYCKFAAHCNTNTFRAPYMKGVQTHGVIQHASFGELKWGIDLNYNSGLGMYYGNIKSGTVLDTFSFATNINSLGTATGSQLHDYIFKNTLAQLPDLINTHVIAYYGDSLKLANLSDEEKAMLASTLPTELIWHEDNKYWTVNYKRNSNFEELTYQELYNKIQNSQLVPGKQYAITDYACTYIQPISLEEMEISADDVKYIVCTAVSANELSENVDYIRENGYVKITECKYDINPENVSWTSGMTTKTPKGVVYYMKDERGNECGYDFKHLKFRRWAVIDIAPCTTPDDGATYPCSPYKVYMTNTAALWKDDRKRIGSGAFDDAALIEGVYSGKWVNTTQECKDYFESTDDNPVEFTDEHVLRCVKPYQNSEWPSAKYIAWAPDMNGTDGFANWKSTKTIHHQATVSTDTSDYRDVYTFDCVGLDASEMMVLDTDTYAVYDVSLFNSKGMKNTPLPNTCFVVSDMNSVQSRAYVYSTSIDIAFNNTILLHPATFYYNWASVRDSKINKLEGNLFIIHLLDNFNVSNSVTQSLFNGGINRFYIGKLDKSVFFGYYASNKLESSENLLWYGTHMYVKLTNTTGDYKFFSDGYAYDNELSVFNDSNILSPMLYCRFRSHFNTNTLRSPYTKGLYIESANQGSSYGKCRWGVHICYGAGSFIRYGSLQSGTVINTYAFSSLASLTSTGIEKVGTVLCPDLTSTTVKGYYSPGVYLQYLSDKEKAMLSESRPTELIYEGSYASTDGYWKVSYASKGVVGDGIDKLVKLTQAEYDALTTKDDNTLYVITE